MYKESRNLWPKQQIKVDLCSFLSLSILMNESQLIWQMFFYDWRISNLETNSYLLYPKHPALQSLLFLASTMTLWLYEDVNIFHNMRVIIVSFNSVQIQCLLLLCPCDHESVWHHTHSHQAEKLQFSHLHLICIVLLHLTCIVFVFFSDIPNTNKNQRADEKCVYSPQIQVLVLWLNSYCHHIISSVRSSNSHPDLLLVQHPLFQITSVLNTGLSLSEPLQPYQGQLLDSSAGYMYTLWVQQDITAR